MTRGMRLGLTPEAEGTRSGQKVLPKRLTLGAVLSGSPQRPSGLVTSRIAAACARQSPPFSMHGSSARSARGSAARLQGLAAGRRLDSSSSRSSGARLRERGEDVRGVLFYGPGALGAGAQPAAEVLRERVVHLQRPRVVARHEAPQRAGGGGGSDEGRDEDGARRKVPARRGAG